MQAPGAFVAAKQMWALVSSVWDNLWAATGSEEMHCMLRQTACLPVAPIL